MENYINIVLIVIIVIIIYYIYKYYIQSKDNNIINKFTNTTNIASETTSGKPKNITSGIIISRSQKESLIPNNISQQDQLIELNRLIQSARDIPSAQTHPKDEIIISKGPIVTRISSELSFQNQVNHVEYIVRNLILEPPLQITELKDISQVGTSAKVTSAPDEDTKFFVEAKVTSAPVEAKVTSAPVEAKVSIGTKENIESEIFISAGRRQKELLIPSNISQQEQIIELNRKIQMARNRRPIPTTNDEIVISKGPMATVISPHLSFQNQLNYIEYIVRHLILDPIPASKQLPPQFQPATTQAQAPIQAPTQAPTPAPAITPNNENEYNNNTETREYFLNTTQTQSSIGSTNRYKNNNLSICGIGISKNNNMQL